MAGTYGIGNTKIKGFDEVMHNLNTEIEAIKNRSMKGLIKSAIIIRRSMDKTPPLIPVKTGNLRASWFVVSAKKIESASPEFIGNEAGKRTGEYNASVAEAQTVVSASGKDNLFLVIGFGANYAAPVHEMYGKGDIDWSRKNSGPKFFESAVKRNKNKIISTIQENAQIKK
jgi:hypothetical protein